MTVKPSRLFCIQEADRHTGDHMPLGSELASQIKLLHCHRLYFFLWTVFPVFVVLQEGCAQLRV